MGFISFPTFYTLLYDQPLLYWDNFSISNLHFMGVFYNSSLYFIEAACVGAIPDLLLAPSSRDSKVFAFI
jgi:hypothetical protein